MERMTSYLRRFFLVTLIALIAWELYMVYFIIFVTGKPLPETFGNFPRVVQLLEPDNGKDEFSFAVVGDTKELWNLRKNCPDAPTGRPRFYGYLGRLRSEGGARATISTGNRKLSTNLGCLFPPFT